MEQEQKHYYAFISYNHADKKEARDLQRWLVHYTFPRSVRKTRSELPRNISVFRDETHLEVGELSPQIVAALEQSDNLIVVCSPNATKSKWVNDEIKYFISLGKSDKIIPYIISGRPYAENIEEECYPKTILELSQDKELLGANITDSGIDAAAIRIVAKMFGLRPDTLYPELKNEKRRKRLVIFSAIIAFILLLIGFIVTLIHQNNKIQDQYEELKIQEQKLRNDSVIMASQMDSINLRDSLMLTQKDSISSINVQLSHSNQLLRIESDNVIREKDNVKAANWKMMERHARLIMAEADECFRKGDAFTATQLMLEIMPDTISVPNKPLLPEMESIFRKASVSHNDRLFSPDKAIGSAEYSPDGKFIVSSSEDGLIHIWDVESKKIIRTLHGHTKSVFTSKYSPDGKIIASASADSTIRIWNANTGDSIMTIKGHTNRVNTVSFSPDGKHIVSASDDESVRVWDAQNWKCINVYHGHQREVCSASYSNDGKYIVSSSKDYTIRVWNAHTGDSICTIHTNSEVIDVSFHPIHNDIIVSAETASWTSVYDFETGKESFCPKQGVPIASIESGKIDIRFYRQKHTVNLWRSMSGERIYTLPESAIYVTYSPDGNYLVTVSGDSKNIGLYNKYYNDYLEKQKDKYNIKVWDANSGDSLFCLEGHSNSITQISFSPNGENLISSSYDRTIRIWDFKTLTSDKIEGVPCRQLGNISNICFSPNEERYALLDSNTIHIVDSKTGIEVGNLSQHSRKVTFCAYGPKADILVSASEDSTIRVWNTITNECEYVLRGHRDVIKSAVISQDSSLLASLYKDNTVFIWDILGANVIDSIEWKQGKIDNLSFLHNNYLLIVTHSFRNIYVWDIRNKKIIRDIAVPFSGYRNALAFSCDGKYLACDTLGFIRIFNMETGEERPLKKKHIGVIRSLYFSNDGKYLVSVAEEDRTIRIWDVATEKNIQTINGDGGFFMAKFSFDGKYIISYSNQQGIQLWDICTNKCVYKIKCSLPYRWANAIEMSSDNYIIIPKFKNEPAKLLQYHPIQEVLDETRDYYKNSTLTPEERRKYYLE